MAVDDGVPLSHLPAVLQNGVAEVSALLGLTGAVTADQLLLILWLLLQIVVAGACACLYRVCASVSQG